MRISWATETVTICSDSNSISIVDVVLDLQGNVRVAKLKEESAFNKRYPFLSLNFILKEK